jgi:hypothetical protein
LPAPALAFEDAYLPLDHWAYPLLDRLQTRTRSLSVTLEERPIARGAAARALEAFHHALSRGELALTETDLGQLALLERELAPETGLPPGARYHAIRWDTQNLRAEWAIRLESLATTMPALASFQPDSAAGDGPEREETLFLWGRPETVVEIGDRVTWQQRFSYRFRFGDTVGRSTLDPSVGEAEFVYNDDDFVGVQRTLDTILGVRLGPARVEAGRLRFAWGPGREGRLLVSGDSPPLDAVRLIARWGRIHLSHAATQLRSSIGERYMAAHRIAYVSSALTVGVSETVVFGNRAYDLAYLSPVQLFYVVESNNGDGDNNLVGVDFRWIPRAGWKLYGEIVVDDSNLRDGWSYYGNKNAFQLGIDRSGLPALPNTDLHAEWSLIDQYTYTHRRPINVAQHFSSPVGHRIGTDADLLTVALNHWISPEIDVRAGYEQERHGEGDISRGSDGRTDDRRNFLTGTVETTRSGFAATGFRSVRGWEGRFELRYTRSRNLHNTRSTKRVEEISAELWIKTQW